MYMSDYQDMIKNYSYKTIENNIGYIAFNAFSNPGRFRVFLDSTFTYIKDHQIKHLIIDIRNNGGGNSMLGDELMQYISKTSFTMCDSCMVKISSELLKRGILNWVDSSKRIPVTLYNFGSIDRTPLRQNPLRFNGDIYLLTSGHTFSSASMFTSAFKCFNAGKIIGTETGGLTVSFGDLYFFRLPETKIGMKVSYKKFYNACGKDNRHGVIPDYIIQNSLQNENNGIDSVLKFTVNLIRGNTH